MKKILSAGIVALAVPFTTLAQSAAAITVPGMGSGVPITIDAFYALACDASNWIFAFVLVIGVIAILGGAVAFLTSRGDEEQVQNARRYVTYALVGVTVAVLARALIYVVGNFLGLASPDAALFAC